jgi:hypothetical protein
MGLSVSGLVDPHLHHPCLRCGYATRYKQWPTPCLCSKPIVAPDPWVEEIWAEQEQKNAELRARTTNCTHLQVASRYANGRRQKFAHL